MTIQGQDEKNTNQSLMNLQNSNLGWPPEKQKQNKLK